MSSSRCTWSQARTAGTAGLPLKGIIDYPNSRPKAAARIKGKWTGALEWRALDLQPRGSAGSVRFQASPLYDHDLRDRKRLASWGVSYLDKRSSEEHPEEWRAPEIPPAP
jgi:hypothetical protein